MKNPRTQALHDTGQRLWLDHVTRHALQSGTLARYIEDLSITGLTSNPMMLENAIASGPLYDESIRVLAVAGLSGEALLLELMLEDLTEAADLLQPVFAASQGTDGRVSVEVSPLLAHDAPALIRATAGLHARAACANLQIKIPGTAEGISATEASIFAGIPVNVTMLFSCEHYLAAAQAYLRGLERRAAVGLDLGVGSTATFSVSPWDVAAEEEISGPLRNRLGIAIAARTFKACRELFSSARWQALEAGGARPQRLAWTGIGTRSRGVPDTLYVEALIARATVDTLPEKTLLAFADHGHVGAGMLADAVDAEKIIAKFRHDGLDDKPLAKWLQREAIADSAKAWQALLSRTQERARPAAAAMPAKVLC